MASHSRLWKILGICGPYTGSLNGAALRPPGFLRSSHNLQLCGRNVGRRMSAFEGRNGHHTLELPRRLLTHNVTSPPSITASRKVHSPLRLGAPGRLLFAGKARARPDHSISGIQAFKGAGHLLLDEKREAVDAVARFYRDHLAPERSSRQ
jgi:hypothetical protein